MATRQGIPKRQTTVARAGAETLEAAAPARQGTRQGERRDEIVGIATELLLEQGCAAMTLGQIAERVGITEPGVYYWVGSKEQLIVDIVQPFLDSVDELLAASPLLDTLAFLQAYAALVDSHREIARLVDQDLIELRRIGALAERIDLQTVTLRTRVESGPSPDERSLASAMIGAIRRPLTVLERPLLADRRQALVAAVYGALTGWPARVVDLTDASVEQSGAVHRTGPPLAGQTRGSRHSPGQDEAPMEEYHA